MSDAFIGANIGELQNLATNLDQTQAQAIEGVMQQVQGLIDGLDATWRGNDAQQFAAEWNSTHRASLQAAIEALRKAGTDARRNAEMQSQTSGQM